MEPLGIHVYADETPSQRTFHPVGGEHTEKMPLLQEIFERILTPLYGSQEEPLKKISLAQDRRCYLLHEQENPVGVVAFKTFLSNEFAPYGIKNSIEIKSLFLIDPERNSGRGLGKVLFQKVIDDVNGLYLQYESFHVTVSETKQDSLVFFRRLGFRVMHAREDRYKKNVIEYLLSRPLQSQSPPSQPAFAQQKSSVPQKSEPLFVIKDAHLDDIHALRLLSDGTFISGSKDNCLCKWSQTGDLINTIKEPDPLETTSRDWITAIEVLNDEYFLSGERNGRVSLWSTAGKFIRHLSLRLPYPGHISDPLNRRRVNCLAAHTNKQNPSFFTGFPKIFDEFNLIEDRTISVNKAHDNDWVFCLFPLTERRLLVVTGGTLQAWEKTNHKWICTETLLREEKKCGKQRSFISSLVPLATPHYFGLSIFNGIVKAFDIEQKTTIQQWREHEGKVWSIENISQEVFASCGEDQMVKFWDVRTPKSVDTRKYTGEVTTLLRLSDTAFVAGVSSSNSHYDGSQLVFHDTRR